MSGQVMDIGARRRRRRDRNTEALLAEAYHRISNHLQLLASLIGLQARETADPEAREALLGVRRRVVAVARLHAELQHAQDHHQMEISSFLGRMAEDLRISFLADIVAGPRLVFEVEPAQLTSEAADRKSVV